jgi:hypothetical protein
VSHRRFPLISIALLGLLASCKMPVEDTPKTICQDGIEYLVFSEGSAAQSIVPHYKTSQGELYSCSERTQK